MLSPKLLKQLAEQHGTPLFVVDHREVRRNYATFRKYLPRVQAYYAVKANPDPGIVRTLFKAGASFDVASMPEFMIVHENIQSMPAKKRQDWIWDKIVYANPVKDNRTLAELDPLQASRHLRQPGRGGQGQAPRPARGSHPAHQRAQYRLGGGAVVQVRRLTGRGRGSD